MDECGRLIAKLVLTGFATFVLTIGGCCAYQSQLIASSKDPIAASCALGASEKACIIANRQP